MTRPSLVVAALIFAPLAAAFAASGADECLGCHVKDGPAPAVDVAVLDGSVHHKLECLACHKDAKQIPHEKKPGRVDCGACHGPGGRGARLPDGRTALESYRLTVHGQAQAAGDREAATCRDCHGNHDIRRHTDPKSRIARAAIATTCGKCHADEAAAFKASVHGRALARGIDQAATCTDCHGEHTIRSPSEPASSVYKGSITKTCSGCHASERIMARLGIPGDRLSTFLDSYHGLAGSAGDLRVANCASCHGWHDIRPAADPKSSVNAKNLAQTCGKCHDGAVVGLSGTKIHASLSTAGTGSGVARWVRLFYLILIPLVIGGLLFHNLLDLFRQALASRRLPHLKHHDAELLLTVSERWQHAGLALSFFALAGTGFALEFPKLFKHLGGEGTRLTLHRGAALLFVLVGVYHAIYLLATKKGRERLRALLPAKRDLPDAIALVLFNLGLAKNRPVLERWSYIEKNEYWALIWGSGVMIVTGAVLLFHNFVLSRLPLWVIEASRVVHVMEAILACLAILVWHFYWAMLDPEIYPMNWAWLSGWTTLDGKKEEPDLNDEEDS